MKKILFATVCALISITFATAQNTFSKGDKVINAGIGLGSTLYSGTGYSMKVPPITGSFEIGIVDHLFDDKSSIGVGGFLGFSSSEFKYGSLYSTNYNYFILGARGAFHYQLVDKLDTYAGLALGYNIVSTNSTYNNSASTGGLTLGGFIGARYYFSDKFAGMAELGYDIAVLKIGIAYKF